MKKYKVKVSMIIDVEADNQEQAEIYALENLDDIGMIYDASVESCEEIEE